MLKRFMLLGLIVLMSASKGFAVDVLWSRDFVRDTGKPEVLTTHFSASYGDAQLLLTNGDASGSKRIRSARVILNGREIFDPSQFSKNVGNLSASVVLGENNVLEVELRGAPGSTFSITFSQEQDAGVSSGYMILHANQFRASPPWCAQYA